MIFMGKSDWFSGENFPNKTNPIKNGMEKIEKVDESGKKDWVKILEVITPLG